MITCRCCKEKADVGFRIGPVNYYLCKDCYSMYKSALGRIQELRYKEPRTESAAL